VLQIGVGEQTHWRKADVDNLGTERWHGCSYFGVHHIGSTVLLPCFPSDAILTARHYESGLEDQE
jgi:hypothetical protein